MQKKVRGCAGECASEGESRKKRGANKRERAHAHGIVLAAGHGQQGARHGSGGRGVLQASDIGRH